MKNAILHFFNRPPGTRASITVLHILLMCTFFGTTQLSAQGGVSLATCPGNIIKNNDPGQCGAIVNFAAVPAAGRNVTIVYSKQSGALFPVGSTDVVVTAYDDNGYESTCAFNVTVVDNEAPGFVNYQPVIAVNTNPNTNGAIVNYTKPAVTQNCIYVNKTFNYTGAAQTFTVPAGVTSLIADLKGAAGGRAASFDGYPYGYPGYGGRVEATIPVTPGQVLTFYIGGSGHDGTATTSGNGGYNGGGKGGSLPNQYTGGGGGGASDIRIAPGTLNDRIVVAGGGGGSGYFGAGGYGGDLTGAEGFGYGTPAEGGSQTAGGAGSNYNSTYMGSNGTFATGGNGATGVQSGGGGGGWYGGGGGAFGDGGGGSSYTLTGATDVLHTQGYQEGNGSVTFTWAPPVNFSQTGGLPSGSVFPSGATVNTFTATDAAGNIAQCTITVNVTDNQKPVITAPANVVVNADNGSCLATNVALGLPVTSDNCGVAGVTNNAPSSYAVGVTNIIWIVTDINGNSSTATQTVTVADNQPPVLTAPANQVYSSAGTYTMPALIVNDNCGIASVSYTVSGTTSRSGSNGNAGGSFNSGISTITWTVTDIHGNSATAVTTIDIKMPQSIVINMADVWTVAPWGSPNTIYLGFGPSSLTLRATPTMGTAPYTYKWKKTGNVSVISQSDSLVVTSEGEYTVVITDVQANTGTHTRNIRMVDLRCGNNGDKVAICHMPSGDPAKAKTICVSKNAVNTFLGNGNYIGNCISGRSMEPEVAAPQNNTVQVFPNPTTGRFTIKLNNQKPTKAEIVLLNTTGRIIEKRVIELSTTNHLIDFDIQKQPDGMYFIKVLTDAGSQIEKVVVQR